MTFHAAIDLPETFTLDGIDEAVAKSIFSVLHGAMSRFEFADCAYHSSDIIRLPIGHLIDHRVRGVLLPPLETGLVSGGVVVPKSDNDWSEAQPPIEAWFDQLLMSSDAPGARDAICTALRLNPAQDAGRLIAIGKLDRNFFVHCTRGRLGSAIRCIPADGWTDVTREAGLDLVANLLVYFSCFSVQMTAARAWWIEHLPFRLDETAGQYRSKMVSRDLKSVAETVLKIAAYVLEREKRYPNRKIVQTLKPQAKDWNKKTELSDNEIISQMTKFFIAIEPQVQKLLTQLSAAHSSKSLTKMTMHKALFGVTDGQAITYAATRLVQLRNEAAGIVKTLSERKTVNFPLSRESFPLGNDLDVASILYVMRIAIMKDADASIDPTEQNRDVEGECDLVTMIQERNSGNLPGLDLINTTRPMFRKGKFDRPVLLRGPLVGAQSFDVLPEFWLQTSWSKVSTWPQMQPHLLERKRRADEEKDRHRPRNVRRASGSDTRGKHKRRRKR